MKGYNGMTYVRFERCSGRNQVKACVQVKSMAELARILDSSTYEVKMYWSPVLNDEMEEALAEYPSGTLLVRADQPGETIDGQEGWVKA